MAMFRNVNLAPIDTSGFERAGAAYGQMFQNLGNTIASSVDKYRAKQEKKQSEEAMERMIKGLPSNVLESFGVDTQDPNMVKQFSKDMVKNPNGANALFAMSSAMGQQDLDRREMEMREKTADVNNALTTFETAALGQKIDQSAKTFGVKTDLLQSQLEGDRARTALTNAQKESVGQSTEANKRLLDGQVTAQDHQNRLTEARIENEKMKQRNADRLFNLELRSEDRLQAAQNFQQAIQAQQLGIQLKLADSEILTNERRLQLQKEQQDNTATMQTLNYFLDSDRFDFNKKFTKKEFNQKKAQIKKQNRIAQKNLNIAQNKLDLLEQQYEDGKGGRELQEELTKARIKLTEAQANGALMGSGSLTEFERGVAVLLSNGEITEERANKLRLQRIKTTAGIESPQEKMEFFRKHTIRGIPVDIISQALDAAKDKTEMFNAIPEIIKEDGSEYLEFLDKEEDKFEILLDKTTLAYVAEYKKVEQEILQQGTSAQPAAGSPQSTGITKEKLESNFPNHNKIFESPRGPELPFNYQNNLSGNRADPFRQIKEDAADHEQTIARATGNPPRGTGENFGLEQLPTSITEGLRTGSAAELRRELEYVNSLPDQNSEWVKSQKLRLVPLIQKQERYEQLMRAGR